MVRKSVYLSADSAEGLRMPDLRKITGVQGVWREDIQEREALQLRATDLPILGTSCDLDNCLAPLGLSFPFCTRKWSEIASHHRVVTYRPAALWNSESDLPVLSSEVSMVSRSQVKEKRGLSECPSPHAQCLLEAGGLRRWGGRREG